MACGGQASFRRQMSLGSPRLTFDIRFPCPIIWIWRGQSLHGWNVLTLLYLNACLTIQCIHSLRDYCAAHDQIPATQFTYKIVLYHALCLLVKTFYWIKGKSREGAAKVSKGLVGGRVKDDERGAEMQHKDHSNNEAEQRYSVKYCQQHLSSVWIEERGM